MNRIKSIRKAFKLSQAEFGNMFNVDQSAVSNWENGKNSIDVSIAQKISDRFRLPLEFVYGVPFKITRDKSEWFPDEIEDYKSLPKDAIEFALFKYGKGVFASQDSEDEDSKIREENESPTNGMTRVTIHGRDGKTEYADFTQEQVELIRLMIKAKNGNGNDQK